MTAESNGAEYRCFITDSAGEMASTRIATVKLDILDWTMEYNTSGQRTKRISDEKTYTYIYADDKLMRMTVGDDVLDFSYDANGAPLTMTYNGTVYYYITNLQGDVTSLQQANGNTGAQYAYDAWGNIIAMTGTLAELNPLRYRGYVYDQETGFYYLNSRYYDPAVMRFISADNYVSTGQGFLGHNMFSYCANNPVLSTDHTGSEPITLSLLTIGTLAAATLVTLYALNKLAQQVAPVLNNAVNNAKITLAHTAKEYRAYAKAVADSFVKSTQQSSPNIHHIVPTGGFKNRGEVSLAVAEMQTILTNANIDPETDPINQMLVSQGHHASLHTNAYLLSLYSSLKQAEGNDDDVRLVLYWYRIVIAATDPWAMGY